MKTLVHFRTGVVLFAILATPCCLAAAANPPAKPSATTHQYVDPFPTVMETTVHYQSRRWLSNSLARINFNTVLAQPNKPWLLVQLPMHLNGYHKYLDVFYNKGGKPVKTKVIYRNGGYTPGKGVEIPIKVEYVLTRRPRLPLKSVIWTGPKHWDQNGMGGFDGERSMVRQEYLHEKKREYLRSFQGLVIFRVNDKIKDMHRIDPIWQVSEKWKSMVKPAWLFCKAHKAWFLGKGPAKHVADLKKLLPDKNLLVAITAFRALMVDGVFRRRLLAGGILKYQGVRLGAYTDVLMERIEPADLPHSDAMARKTRSNEQALWLDAGVIESLSRTPFQNRFADRLDQAIQRRLPPSLRWKIPSGVTIFNK